jgi:hypothetical protein
VKHEWDNATWNSIDGKGLKSGFLSLGPLKWVKTSKSRIWVGMSLEFRGMVNKCRWVLIVWHVNIKIIDILQRICSRDVTDFWHLYGESVTTMPQIFHFVLEKMRDPWLRFQPIGNMQQLFLRILNILKF